jgi:hypothetical protein
MLHEGRADEAGAASLARPAGAVNDGCGAPAGGHAAPRDGGSQAVVQGRVTKNGAAVVVGYARLLDTGGIFVAEVPLGEDGGFRFFPAAGTWTLRVLAPGGVRVERTVSTDVGHVTNVEVRI